VDQRFVGTWAENPEFYGPSAASPEKVLVLNEDGTGECFGSTSWGPKGPFKWWVRNYSDENTSIVMQFPSARRPAIVFVQLLLSRCTVDVSPPIEIEEWDTWDLTSRSMEIGPPGATEVLIRLK
jgi:hypothetical protein